MSVLFKVDRMSPENRAKITSRFNKYSEDLTWILGNMDWLKENFPNMYIAVENRSVMDSDDDFKRLKKRMQRAGKDLENYTIEFIQTGETKYLF